MNLRGRNLHAGMTGDDVAALHRDLVRLGHPIPPAELRDKTFGVGTAAAVAAFQKARRLLDTAVVDPATAEALGRAVAERAEGQPTPQAEPAEPAGERVGTAAAAEVAAADVAAAEVAAAEVVAAEVVAAEVASGAPARTPLTADARPDAALVSPPATDGPRVETDRPPGAGSPAMPEAAHAAVRRVRQERGDERPHDAPEAPDLAPDAHDFAPGAREPAVPPTRPVALRGRVYFDHGLPAADLKLRFYESGFAGRTRLLADATTGADGSYEVDLRPDTRAGLLEVRAVGVGGAEVRLTGATPPTFGQQLLNLVAPAARVAPLKSEYERLLADLTRHLGGARLGEARETGQGTGGRTGGDGGETDSRADITLLREATGWDARLIALAVTADRLAPATGIAAPAMYGLLRAGLPTTASQLALVTTARVGQALVRATEANVVELAPVQVQAAVAAHTRFAKASRRASVAPGTLHGHGEMLAATGLSAADQDRFDQIHAQHAGDGAALWDAVQRAGLPADRLRLAGKLGYLTLNNARLTDWLQRQQRIVTVADLPTVLVEQGYYRADTWVQQLGTLAGGTEGGLDALIPPVYPGVTAGERLTAYATDLARKVRLAYPTQVVAQMVAADELPLGTSAPVAGYQTVKTDVGVLLARAGTLGFRLGATPVSAFLSQHEDALFAGIVGARAGDATRMLKTLQRLYQISPGDDAMKVLLANGFTAARDVTAVPHRTFVDKYGQKFANKKDVDRVYRKALQVTSTTYAFFGSGAGIDSTPPMYGTMPAAPVVDAAKKNLLKHFPTLESLFGSLDFCECDHCRSVLSPAAYLVDLLKFLDPDPKSWSGPGPTPYKVLSSRRPDLPELPLTCENTNTVLPYIDVVNEILEYYVAHNGLGPGAAYDTGGADSADLIAEPQRVLTNVYDDVLGKESYPLALPFSLWLETVRRFFDHFGTPLWSVLEALRPGDSLYAAGQQAYARADVFIERLGPTPAEVTLLTEPDPTTTWHELYGYPSAAQALAQLASAKTLSHRLGVSYRELVELVRTWFVNPRLGTLAALRKLAATKNLDLDVADVLRYQGASGYPPFSPAEKAQFETTLTPAGLAWLKAAWSAGDFAHMLVLADPDAGCSFEQTTLRYANGAPADATAFLTLNYLVRLSRRLGWSIGETDRALRVFLPTSPDPRTLTTIGTAVKSALLGLAHLDALATDLGISPRRRPTLLDLWADLSEQRYAELFLTPRVLADDPVFDHPLGQYLRHLDAGVYVPFHWDPTQEEDATTGNVSLATHLGAVQGALKLTADDISLILRDAASSLAAAPLTVTTLSVLNRHGLLAKALRVSVAELIALKAMSGLNPFAPVSASPITTIADNLPYTQTIGFVQAVGAVKASGLSVADLDYVLRHDFDPVGPFRTSAVAPLGLVRTLAREIARIRAEHAVPADALDLTDEVLRQKLALILGTDVVDTFLGMWTGTIAYHAGKPTVALGDALDPQDLVDVPAITVEYDPVSQEQRLSYRGVLVDAVRTALVAAHPEPAVAELLAAITAQAKDFFARNLQVSVVGTEPVGFLTPADFDAVFTPVPAGSDEATVQTAERARRATLATAFLPYLQERLIRALVFRSVAGELGSVEPALVESLLADANLLIDRAHPGEKLLAAFATADANGLTRTGDANSAVFEGYLEVAAAGDYRFFVVCENAGSTVALRMHHLADPLLEVTTTNPDEESSGYTMLPAGVAHRLTLTATGLAGGAVTVLVQGEHLPKGPLDRLRVCPAATVERMRRAYTLIGKVGRLATATELTEAELRHVLLHRADFAKLDLSWLPTGATDDAPDHTTDLFGQLRRVLDYRALRRDLDAEPADLLDVVSHARRTFPASAVPAAATGEVFEDVCARFGRITRREQKTVAAAAGALGIAATSAPGADGLEVSVPGFVDERGLGRIWTVLRLAAALGVSPNALSRWADPDPDSALARDLRDTVKARYEPESWRRVAQPIFDRLRQRRRDALVAYLLHGLDLDRVEQLFELLLIDPGMEPVVRTSRLRTAISSVQLFVQRCLLNLEVDVDPTAIDAARWQWMRRYRVWEANRKIFLYPENWLEPEFRDQKSHLFTELEGVLLQGDLSDDLAEEALVGYLRQLEELARLDIRAMCLQERDEAPANVVHVVARTHSVPQKYFYRSYSRRRWTPWIPVTADIEGDHLVVVVWRERLYLFWVTFLEKADTEANSNRTPQQMGDQKTSSLWPQRKLQVQLNWSEYFQGQWTARASGGFTHPVEVSVSHFFDTRQVLMHATIDDDGACLVHLNHIDFPKELSHVFRVVSRHSGPTVKKPAQPYPDIPYWADLEWGRHHYNGVLGVSFVEKITNKMGVVTEESASEAILNENHDFRFTTAGTPPANVPADLAPLVSPFFLTDERRAFFVEPVATETTVDKWEDWLVNTSPVEVAVPSNVKIISQVQTRQVGPPIPDPIGPVARFAIQPTQDWLTASGAVTQLDGTLIGAHGGVTLEAYRGVTRGLYVPVSGTTRVAPIIAREGNR